MKLAPLFLVAGLTLGCAPNIWLRTPSPPATTLTFDAIGDRIELTQGVAAAFEISCPWDTCLHAQAVTDAPAVAQVYPAHLATLQHAWITHNTPMLALVGMGPGQTTLHVSERGRVHDYRVSVLPATPK